MRRLAITTGDPAGIGPEIALKALRYFQVKDNIAIIVYGRFAGNDDGNQIVKIDDVSQANSPAVIYWIEIDDDKIEIGKPSALSGEIALEILNRCANDLNSKKLDAVVTCPISKEALHFTRPDFIGHTEFFAEKSETKDVIMSFWGPHFNLALLTTHLPICEVPGSLSDEIIEMKLRLIYRETGKLIQKPRIAMLAVNPHAGEGGAFGSDDIRIKKILDFLRIENINIDGPFPADTFFATKANQYNMIISAFHDQGLIPFKMISAEEGVNVTLGLPFIRTSVDHGTAFDIAGKNIASEKSLLQAINFAEKMLQPLAEHKEVNYTKFAKYYDQYMAHVNYEDWINFILMQFSKKFKRNPKHVLELACGTGNISCLLVKKGLKVDASDISEEMIKIAAQKPFHPNLMLQNMTSLLPVGKYELILLLFDSLNYLNHSQEILKMLKNIYSALLEKGLFIFDITTPKNCEQNFDGFVNLEDSENEYLIHQSDYDQKRHIQTTHLTFFLKKGFLFERFDEVHNQKIYLVEDIVNYIKKTKFKIRGIHSIGFKENLKNTDLRTLDQNFSRLFFVLEK
ncbi:MAG: 4-hydroxythreonine-4-phosphate dehydrogenase PdxA [Candidatus Cloacimonadales bacterium]|nr:4-hydroxythreonine-4-phosphate dehydrogenase PdxA [Candidatus Cloacimonadales bacterium]